MKKYSVCLSIIVVALAATSTDQEFIKPKTKKKYPSEQQSAELDGDLVVEGTALSAALVNLSQKVIKIVQEAIGRVNGYANGEKSSDGKCKRLDLYEKKLKIKQEIESATAEIVRLQEHIAQLADDLDGLIDSD